MLNKKEDSRAISRWAKANKSRSAGINITRRPSLKGAKNDLSKKPTRPILSFWSAILDQRRFYYALRYSVGCSLMYFVSVSIVSSTCCTHRVFSLSRMCTMDDSRSVQEKGSRCWRGRWRKRMKRKRSTRRCRRNERWQKGVGPDMGESPSSLGRQRENAPYLLFNYRFIAWSSDRWRHDVYRNTWCGSANITVGLERRSMSVLQFVSRA